MTSLTFHPLADIFPLMEGAEFEELVADIKANGQHARIVLKDGMVLDGRNRYRACCKLGIEPSFACETYSGQIMDPAAYVISANIHRRHLTADQKRELIGKVIAAKPEASDRQIAKQVKADHKTVGAIRKKKEATGEISPVEKRTGADGKVRKQPARKAKPEAKIENSIGPDNAPDPETGAAAMKAKFAAMDNANAEPPAANDEQPAANDEQPAANAEQPVAEQPTRKERRKLLCGKAECLAEKLAKAAPEIARELHDVLWEDDRITEFLVGALRRELGLDEGDDNETENG
jgi:hypothetical protein